MNRRANRELVIPAEAGIQSWRRDSPPAFAGVTSWCRGVVVLAVLALGGATAGAVAPPIEHNARWWQEPLPGQEPVSMLRSATPRPEPRPSCKVDVYENEPSEPFDLIGLVEVKEPTAISSPERALTSAKLEACRIGGDALIVLHRKEPARSGMVGAVKQGAVFREPALRAAVIRRR